MADDEQQQWCDKERTNTGNSISQKTNDISTLVGQINDLDFAINDPATGLLKQQAETENSIEENRNSKASQTEQRKKDHAEYEKDVSNLVDAQALLQRAIVVLRKYYSQISSEISSTFLQDQHAESPDPPQTWNDKYMGR